MITLFIIYKIRQYYLRKGKSLGLSNWNGLLPTLVPIKNKSQRKNSSLPWIDY